jgi:hypothetical protein
MNKRLPVLLVLPIFVLLLLLAACGGSEDEPPTVKIVAPLDPYTLELGETLTVESRARDDNGVSQVELRINGVQVDLQDVPGGETSFRTAQSWLAPQVGRYTVTVIAYDKEGQASEPAGISVDVEPAPTPAPTFPAASSVTATPVQTSASPADCAYNAAYVADVTIPDGTELAPGAEFIKIWRLRNSGTCPWGAGTQLVLIEGEGMGGPAAVELPTTPAGGTIELEVPLIAPEQPGTYRSVWRPRAPSGQSFGDSPYVQIVVSLSITPTPSVTPTVTPPPLPDLDITLVSGNLELETGQPLELKVTIRNHGPGATTQPALVRVILPPDLETDTSVPTLPAGGEVVASISHIFAEPGEHEVFVSVDPDDQITEEDETNNSERIPVIINPPVYATRTITMTPGVRADLDDAAEDEGKLDVEWRVVEGTVYVGLLNGAGAAPLGGDAVAISYGLVSGLTWETDQLVLPDLAQGTLFAFRTNDDRFGYAQVDEVLDQARTNARLTYVIWDWP